MIMAEYGSRRSQLPANVNFEPIKRGLKNDNLTGTWCKILPLLHRHQQFNFALTQCVNHFPRFKFRSCVSLCRSADYLLRNWLLGVNHFTGAIQLVGNEPAGRPSYASTDDQADRWVGNSEATHHPRPPPKRCPLKQFSSMWNPTVLYLLPKKHLSKNLSSNDLLTPSFKIQERMLRCCVVPDAQGSPFLKFVVSIWALPGLSWPHFAK